MLLFASYLAAVVIGHGAVTHPKPRQSIDGTIPPWSGAVPAYPVPFLQWCERPDSDSDDPRNISGSNGQACFWFNNGCDIGCDKCDGVSGQKIPCCNTKFLWTGPKNSTPPSWSPSPLLVADPKYVAAFNISKMRPTTATNPTKPTICDPKLRTINTGAECGSRSDFWHYTPWRYPGKAPVTDSCGTAGGVLPGMGEGGAGASYTNTAFAKVGDLGSKLPPLDTKTVWSSGSAVEVAWNFKAWHGGGYTYRLCPVKEGQALDEECFQSTPPPTFVGNSTLRWGGKGGEELSFSPAAKGWEVSTGTVPAGSTWRKFPIPRSVNEWNMYGATFEPVCEESEECKSSHYSPPRQGVCKCSGDWNDRVEIVDMIQIPQASTLKPGKYVLGWRWDCEESTQVWTSCSDVTIVA